MVSAILGILHHLREEQAEGAQAYLGSGGGGGGGQHHRGTMGACLKIKCSNLCSWQSVADEELFPRPSPTALFLVLFMLVNNMYTKRF